MIAFSTLGMPRQPANQSTRTTAYLQHSLSRLELDLLKAGAHHIQVTSRIAALLEERNDPQLRAAQGDDRVICIECR